MKRQTRYLNPNSTQHNTLLHTQIHLYYIYVLYLSLFYSYLFRLSFYYSHQKNIQIQIQIMKSVTSGAGADDVETSAMNNCLMILANKAAALAAASSPSPTQVAEGRKFACKQCPKTFNSFQALGGHCASHQKIKPASASPTTVSKPKTHACSVCKLEFPTGQALGGHMRRHRTETSAPVSTVTSEVSVKEEGEEVVDKKRKNEEISEGAIMLMKSKSNNYNNKRVCLDLNLNFEPWVSKKEVNNVKMNEEIEEGEIVEDEEEYDFLKLELRPPGPRPI